MPMNYALFFECAQMAHDTVWRLDSKVVTDLADRWREFVPVDVSTDEFKNGGLPFGKRGHLSTSNRFA